MNHNKEIVSLKPLWSKISSKIFKTFTAGKKFPPNPSKSEGNSIGEAML